MHADDVFLILALCNVSESRWPYFGHLRHTTVAFFLCGAPNQKKTALLGREREIKHSFFLDMCNLQSCSSEILELEIRARTAF